MPALRTRDTQSRSLEVTTDGLEAPALNIVSPTPRTFTFPVSHNLADSPYSSPSNSPFEPDHFPLPSQCTINSTILSSHSTPPPLHRPLSPDSPLRSASPTPGNHKRRKSSCSSDIVERRPKKGDEDYIKRPENAFILFRRKCCEDRQQAQDEAATLADGPAKKQRQADLSKTISQQWKGLSGDKRQYWEQLAKDKKKEHEQMYPNYVYRPQRAKDKDGRSKNNKKLKKFDYENPESLSFIVPTIPRQHGRSASAPTPPPYQSIQIPNVYHLTPSCPTSPSLLPMISRRSAHPGHPEEAMSNFDYLPTNSFVPPSFATGQFEASLQSSEFLRSMFNIPATVPRNEPSHLQQLSMPPSEALLLPPHQIVSPSSSTGSGSSGPSSPTSGPYTPLSAPILSQNYSSDANLEAQAQAEMDLQLEMQMQQEFAAFSWGNNGSFWSMDPPELLEGDFDLSSIPPIELGGKFTESVALPSSHPTGLEFGQEFNSLEGRHYHDSQNLGNLLNFDQMMAGHGF